MKPTSGGPRRLRVGKLPADLLARCLAKIPRADSRVIVWPKIGEDAAVVEAGGALLVAKTDPITFATDLIGWYAVHINANDVACMGATPLWFMADLLLPEGAASDQADSIFDQMLQACGSLGISLIGGHTEITYGLERPIVAGCLLGEVTKERLVTSSGARPGDDVVLTKGIAVEGTALLAREASAALSARGVGEALIERATDLLFDPGISVVADAKIACSAAHVTSMHDPTEGGLATGLEEVAAAAGVGFRIEQERIPVLEECRILCSALGLDPLGLLASGCLIATVPSEQSDALVRALSEARITATVIGRVVPGEQGITLCKPGAERPLPHFERDEVARFFASP